MIFIVVVAVVSSTRPSAARTVHAKSSGHFRRRVHQVHKGAQESARFSSKNLTQSRSDRFDCKHLKKK
jgi:hypothetical protein